MHNTAALSHINMVSLRKQFAILVFAAGTHLQGQAGQSPANCDSSAYDKAGELLQQEAPNAFPKALELYKEALRCTNPGDSAKTATIFLNIGRIQAQLERLEEALASFSSALEELQKINDLTAEDRRLKAAVIVNLAYSFHGLGRIDEALPRFNQALELFHGLDDKMGEAYALGELGLASFLMGDNEGALSYYDRALVLRNNIDAADLKNQRLKAAVLDLAGRVYARLNQTGLAQSYYRDALSLARKTNNHTFVAYTLNDIGILLLKQNQPQLAEQNHLEAKAELEKYEPENRNGLAETRALLGDAQVALGKHDLAQENYHAALSLQQQSGDVVGEAETRYSLGLLESSSNPPEARLESLTQAAEIYHRVHHREGESQARFHIAKLLSLRDDPESARSQMEMAIQLGEEVRSSTPGRALRTGYFASLENMYRFEINLLLNRRPLDAQSNQIRALNLIQHAQARTLIDALEIRSSPESLMPAGEISQNRKTLLAELKKQNGRLQWLLQNTVKPQLLDETFNAVQKLETSLDEQDAEAQKRNPNLGFFSEKASVSIAAIQQHILDPDSALIQFFLDQPASYAWVITPSSINMVTLPARQDLERGIQNILHFGSDNRWTNRQQLALRDLYQELAPIFAIVKQKRWIVVPDGLLNDFPVALLTMPFPGKPVQGPQEVVKIPSIAAIDIVRKQNRVDQPAKLLAVFADPVFDRLDSRVMAGKNVLPSEKERGMSFSRLLYSRQEMQLISRFVPPNKTRSFTDFSARAADASGDALKGFKIIHFATHSVVDGDHPELSRIVFSLVSKDGKPQTPGYLMLKDIYRMQLSSDLVVLSSCRGASGKEQPGEGPMSLSRAFLFAGSKAVVAPLWEVDDEATAQFMGRFYKYTFQNHLPPISALKRAQDDFRTHPSARLHNPYYWASFELYGDWVSHWE